MKDTEQLAEERKRIAEFIIIIFCSFLLLFISRMESKLFSLSENLSENREFFTTIIYFGLININVILILFLGFLIFRNITKLVVERKRGLLGSRLKSKLIVALVFFALAPTILLFYVSMRFITSSFETWFSERVRDTMRQTREAGSLIYKRDQKRMQGLARLGLQRIDLEGPEEYYDPYSFNVNAKSLEGFAAEYGITAVQFFKIDGTLLWSSDDTKPLNSFVDEDPFVTDAIAYFLQNQSEKDMSELLALDKQDVVKGAAPLWAKDYSRLYGIVVTQIRFETQILKSIENIISDFANLKPGAQLIQFSYMILMLVITLLIVFCALWLGFYVARAISEPLQQLAYATKEIALGNYEIQISVRTDDETGQLVKAFNTMALDLRKHEERGKKATAKLQKTNEELDQRRQYMEVVLKHIEAGVISVNKDLEITSVNSAAEKILGVEQSNLANKPLQSSFSQELFEHFWRPILNSIAESKKYSGTINLSQNEHEMTISVNATTIYDENEVDVGFVVVFNDAQKQMQAQKAAAWREVARRIAHEIKNPITPIKLNAQRMLRRFNDKFKNEDHEVFRTCMETIIAQVDSLRDLVNEFSKFARLPSIKPELTNLRDILLDIVKFFKISYPEVYFDSTKIENVPAMLLDKEQINRAIVNLLTNAIAALDNSGDRLISLSCTYIKEMSSVRIEISDNGCGIPHELHDRVLEPYFSTKDEGTGLGLAITNQIVSDHGGYLRLSANHPKGTTASIELPLEFKWQA